MGDRVGSQGNGITNSDWFNLPSISSGFAPQGSELNYGSSGGNYLGYDQPGAALNPNASIRGYEGMGSDGIGIVSGNVNAGNVAGGAGGGLGSDILGGKYGGLEGWGQMLGGVGDVAGAYMAYKNYGLANDQFDFQKAVTNRNLANQSTIANQRMAAWSKARGMAPVTTDGSVIT